MRFSTRLRLAALAAIGLSATLLVACGGEDRPNVDVIDDGSSSGSDTSSGSATGEPAGPGVVEDKPEGATEVDVTLQEWQISTSTASVEAGEIYFKVNNVGPEDAHEFVIVRTDLAPGELPLEDGKVPEDEIDLVDEIEPFTPGSSASITVNLKPGNYVFICNIADNEDGELESHYQLGMRTAFTVE
jgi:uncharacterized cupredoxin-like copper-binding protein